MSADTAGPPVLLVDDDPLLLRAMSRLAQRAGAEVTTASNGEEALGRMAERDFALVVCDMRMPGLDGRAVLERSRALSTPPPFVILSGYTDHREAELMALGAAAVLGKPISSSDLRTLIERHDPARAPSG